MQIVYNPCKKKTSFHAFSLSGWLPRPLQLHIVLTQSLSSFHKTSVHTVTIFLYTTFAMSSIADYWRTSTWDCLSLYCTPHVYLITLFLADVPVLHFLFSMTRSRFRVCNRHLPYTTKMLMLKIYSQSVCVWTLPLVLWHCWLGGGGEGRTCGL